MSQLLNMLLNLGLGKPAPLKRGDEAFIGTILVGGGETSPCVPAIETHCQRRQLGLARSGDPEERYQALLFDGTALTTPSQLKLAYTFFHNTLRSLASCGRIIIFSRPHKTAETAEAAACQRALEGLTRSLAKESGRKGITAQLVCVEPGAEANLESTLDFLLSYKSAYVDGQVIRVRKSERSVVSDPPPPSGPLSGKTALVTGASRGIGAAIASTLARDGAKVIGLDVEPMREDLETLIAYLDGEAVIADITAETTPTELLRVAEKHRGLDIVVHNAGVTRDKTLANMPEHWWDMVISINLSAALNINKTLLEHNAINAGGRIIGVSSMNGIAGQRGQSNYAASKAGVIGYVEQMADELYAKNITINAVAPGFIETQMTETIPLMTREVGRRLNSLAQAGQPIDVAEAIAFFADPASSGITGNIVRVCGQNWLGA